MITAVNGYSKAPLPTSRCALRLAEDTPPAAQGARQLPRGLLRQPQGRPAPARGPALRRAPRQLRPGEGGRRPRGPARRDARPGPAAPRRGHASPRLHLPRPGSGGLAAARGPPAPGRGGRPPGRAAAAPLRDLLGSRRRLADGGARLRPQHDPGLARRAPRGRAGARLLPRGGGDPAEPPRRGAAGVRRLRPRRALGRRGRGRGRFLRLRGLRQRDAGRLDRRRERPRAPCRAPRARRGDGAAHGDREGAQGRARLREAEPGHPPLAALEPLRERLLRRAGARTGTSST